MAYLTQAEYLERFDAAETNRITGGDTLDEAKLETAIQSASDMADAYFGSRYALPLDPVPAVVKDIVADLARERLFTLHPNEEVTDRADRARTALKDIARGVMVLVSAGALVDEASADEPEVYTPTQVFTDSLLGSYRGRMQ